LVTFVTFGGCSSGGTASKSTTGTTSYSVQLPTVTVAAGQERYVCYTRTLDADLAVDRFDYAAKSYVHHIFFSRTLQPEPDGVSECDVLFRTTWIPLFVAGNGSAHLAYPQGAATLLPKGTQIVVQLHLLNASSGPQDVNVDIEMRRSTEKNPVAVGLYAFGTQRISLAPNAASSISYECTTRQDIQSFTMLAHMHRLGTKMTLEVADGSGAYHEVFRRDPYDFNNQFLDPAPLQIAKGTKTRITCTYDNTTNAAVTYGESTNNEMCFLATFVTGQQGPTGCIEGPNAGDAGTGTDASACTPTANAMGVGAGCTAGGNECPSGLQCSADLSSSSGPGFCLKIGCTTASECGAGATCCAPPQGGGIKVCLPTACAPASCPAN